ncbi:MAG TPA: thiamine ABC transporter ATP-binding protein [Aestuariivirga sp.]|jgi:thiamine transport system ATP-binding protein|nr:thiamine ABC transporter ATP-binding protein [Aestuariivirga sp.]
MIKLENVGFRYEDMVMNFDLQAAKGELVGIIGPSGAGKSTLLSLIAGFDLPISGRISIAGVDMEGVVPDQRPVSMIFQDHNSFAHLDVWTNVALGISPDLKLDPQQRERVDTALARVGLSDFRARKPTELSGGERQRIAIARALVRDKPVLLLDEPFTALGPALRRDMLDLIKEIQKEKQLTVLMVTHQPEDAKYAASKIAFVQDGRITDVLPTRQFFADKAPAGIRAYLA